MKPASKTNFKRGSGVSPQNTKKQPAVPVKQVQATKVAGSTIKKGMAVKPQPMRSVSHGGVGGSAPKSRKSSTLKVGRTGPIPQGQPVKGMSLKMPKKGKGNVGEQIDKRLQKKSPWFTSITNPLEGADCKIPDDTGVETGTVQLVQNATFTTNANGVGGIRISCPYINDVPNGVAGTVGQNYQLISSTSSQIMLVWGNSSAAGEGYAFEGQDDMKGVTNQHRIVSAGLYVEPEPALASNQGEFCLFAEDFAASTYPLYSDYLNIYKATSVPVNSNRPGLARWFPVARQDWTFKSFIRTDAVNVLSDDITQDVCPPWTLGCIASGCATGVVFRVRMVVNYEFIPRYNSLNVLGVSPSPQDQQEVDLVEGWVQEMPVASTVSVAQASKSASSVSPSHDDDQTGFGMFFNVLQELAPLALGLLI